MYRPFGSASNLRIYLGEIDWEHPGIHRGNLITCAGSERVTDRVCS